MQYEVGGWYCDNEILETAFTYIKSAEILFRREEEKTGCLERGNWCVVHHLSVIAVELLAKAICAKITPIEPYDEDGYAEVDVTPGFAGRHHYSTKHELEKRSSEHHSLHELRQRLGEDQWSLLTRMVDDKTAKSELTKGRYPFEKGPIQREEALRWLSTANEVASFINPGRDYWFKFLD